MGGRGGKRKGGKGDCFERENIERKRTYLDIRIVASPNGAHTGGFVPCVALCGVFKVGVRSARAIYTDISCGRNVWTSKRSFGEGFQSAAPPSAFVFWLSLYRFFSCWVCCLSGRGVYLCGFDMTATTAIPDAVRTGFAFSSGSKLSAWDSGIAAMISVSFGWSGREYSFAAFDFNF